MSGTKWGANKLASQYQPIDAAKIKEEYQPRVDWDESKFYFKPDMLRDLHSVTYDGQRSTSLFKVNLSPLIEGHSLYVPFIEGKHP